MSDGSSDVCSSDVAQAPGQGVRVVDGSEVVGGDIGDHGRILRNAPRVSGKPHGSSHATRGGARTAPPKAGAYTMRRQTLPRVAWQPNPPSTRPSRSEEHTYELQSIMRILYDVYCVKKKKK